MKKQNSININMEKISPSKLQKQQKKIKETNQELKKNLFNTKN